MEVDTKLKYTKSPTTFNNEIDHYYEFDNNNRSVDEKFKFRMGNPYPEDKILAEFSNEVYYEPTEGSRPMPDGWTLLTIAYNKELKNKYLGAAYWNPKEQHIVVAHRGTVVSITKTDTIGSILTDVYGVMQNKYTGQMRSAITFAYEIKSAVENANRRSNVFIQLSFTGHSLGGWLAQITTLSVECFSFREVESNLFRWSPESGYHAHTVVFDSPGCIKMLQKMEPEINNRRRYTNNNCFNSRLDITIYLSTPNLVNTCSQHYYSSTIYRVLSHDDIDKFETPTWKTHSIERIKEILKEIDDTNLKWVKNWPMVEEKLSLRITKFFSPLPYIGRLLAMFPTLHFFGRMLKAILPSRLFNQHYNELELLLNEGSAPSLNDKIAYHSTPINRKQCSCNTLSLSERDFVTKCKRLEKPNLTRLDEAIKPLGNLKDCFKDLLNNCPFNSDQNLISSSGNRSLFKFISVIKNIVHIIPSVKENVNQEIWDFEQPVWFQVSNITPAFTDRINEIDEISKIHFGSLISELGENDCHDQPFELGTGKLGSVVVASSRWGIGKSELAIKYAHEFRSHYAKHVILIHSRDEESVYLSFSNLMTQLKINMMNDDNSGLTLIEMKERVFTYFCKERALFIFDGTESFPVISSVLPPVSFNFRVLITTRNEQLTNELERENGEIRLGPLFVDYAVEMVKKKLALQHTHHDHLIKILVLELDGLPMKLLHAVEKIKSLDLINNIEQYVQLVQAEVTDDENVFYNQILTASKLSLGNIAKLILNIAAFLNPYNIPDITFCKLTYETICEDYIGESDMASVVNSALESLEKSYIIRRETGKFNISRIVQNNVKIDLKTNNMEKEVLKQALELLEYHLSNPKTFQNYTPSIVSVWNVAFEYKELVEEFIICKCDDNNIYTTYLHLVVSGCSLNAVESIVNGITDKAKLKLLLHTKDKERKTVLHCAALTGDERKVKLLLKKGSNANDKKIYGWTSLHLAAKGGYIESIRILIDYKAKVDTRTEYGLTALHLAARNGLRDVVKLLLDKGADVNASDRKAVTPLHFAVKEGHSDVAKVLLGNDKINVNVETNYNLTPLHFAVRNNKIEGKLMELIISKGADINIADIGKFTPLHSAAASGRVEIVSLLLKTGEADINAQTSHGNTPLHLAAEKGHVEVVNKLIAHGTDQTIVNNKGQTFKLPCDDETNI